MWPFKKKQTNNTVLIIEDDQEFAHSIQFALEAKGIDSKICGSVFEAGAALMNIKPGVVTLDISMPGFVSKKAIDTNAGFTVLEFIREQPALKDVKVIVVSGMEESVLQETLKCGANEYIQKPFKMAVLEEKILRLMSAK